MERKISLDQSEFCGKLPSQKEVKVTPRSSDPQPDTLKLLFDRVVAKSNEEEIQDPFKKGQNNK